MTSSLQRATSRRRNEVEIWFSKVERVLIARGVFTSVTDLARKQPKYICAYDKSAQPFRWTYTGERACEIPVIMSNHSDAMPLEQFSGLPFHEIPVQMQKKPKRREPVNRVNHPHLLIKGSKSD